MSVKLTRPRVILVLMGALLAIVGVGQWYASHDTAVVDGKLIHVETLWPLLWPWWFWLAALGCFALAATMTKRVLKLTALLVPLVCAGRVCAVLSNLIHHAYLSEPKTIGALAVWALMAVMSSSLWLFALNPVVSWYDQKRSET